MNRKALFAVLVLILLAGMMVSVFLGNIAGADGQSSDSNGDPNTWPMFHGDLSHTGYSTSTAPLSNQTLWEFSPSANIYYSEDSPVVAQGVVYIGSIGGLHSNSSLYALNAETGTQIWSYSPSVSYLYFSFIS